MDIVKNYAIVVSFAVQGVLLTVIAILVAKTLLPTANFSDTHTVIGSLIMICGIVQVIAALIVMRNSVFAMHILFRGFIDITAGMVSECYRGMTLTLFWGLMGMVLLEKGFTGLFLGSALQIQAGVLHRGKREKRPYRMVRIAGVAVIVAAIALLIPLVQSQPVPQKTQIGAIAIAIAFCFYVAAVICTAQHRQHNTDIL